MEKGTAVKWDASSSDVPILTLDYVFNISKSVDTRVMSTELLLIRQLPWNLWNYTIKFWKVNIMCIFFLLLILLPILSITSATHTDTPALAPILPMLIPDIGVRLSVHSQMKNVSIIDLCLDQESNLVPTPLTWLQALDVSYHCQNPASMYRFSFYCAKHCHIDLASQQWILTPLGFPNKSLQKKKTSLKNNPR